MSLASPRPLPIVKQPWVCALLGAAALTLLIPQAQAEEASAKTVVRFHDLDLRRDSDVRALYARLENAAESVCGYADARDLERVRMKERCVEETLSSAVAQVDHSAMTALHRENGRIRVARRAAQDPSRT